MEDYAEIRSGQISWTLGVIHAVQDWEMESVAQPLEDLSQANIRHGKLDKLVWIP